ncbi:MAG: mechanosensitive ion channel family protein [Polyangiaceae bacterium]|nr:mechanosensitive ion channel family protein [Polyangiaceae bacterium]
MIHRILPPLLTWASSLAVLALSSLGHAAPSSYARPQILDGVDDAAGLSFAYLGDTLTQYVPASLRGEVFGVALWQYLALLSTLLVGLVIRKIIQFVVSSRLKRLAGSLGQAWAARFVDVFASPGATLAMAVLLGLVYPELGLPDHASKAVSVAVRLLVVVSLVWAVYRLVDVLAERMAAKAAATESKLDDQLVPLIRKSLKLLTLIAGLLFVLENLSVDVTSLLAGLGIGGVAVALAAKDTLANFFGGIMIFVDRPFQIGDWVVVSGVEGIVDEVGFRSTRIRTFYNSLVTIPNAKFMEANIDNYGARRYRRSKFTLNVTYDTTPEQMQAFVEGIRGIIQANPTTRKDYYEVHMSGFGASSLDVLVYFFFEVKTWSEELEQRHYVLLEILRLARKLGVVFAFPTQTLHVDTLAAPGAEPDLPAPMAPEQLGAVVHAFAPGGAAARPRGVPVTHGYFAGRAANVAAAAGEPKGRQP